MDEFPEFMRNPANKIAATSQFVQGIQGYVFDGADGSQIAIWTNPEGGDSAEHTHEYDEYMVVAQGKYTVLMEGNRKTLTAGDEIFIPKSVPHAGESSPGTRTIHAFGGKRAERAQM